MEKVVFCLTLGEGSMEEEFDIENDFGIDMDKVGFDLDLMIQQKYNEWVIKRLSEFRGLVTHWDYK